MSETQKSRATESWPPKCWRDDGSGLILIAAPKGENWTSRKMLDAARRRKRNRSRKSSRS